MCMCVFVCVCVCAHAHECALYVRMHTCIRVCKFACVHVSVRERESVCVCVCARACFILCVYIVYIYIYIYMHVCIHMYTYIYTHTYIHIQHIYTYTYINIYIGTASCARGLSGRLSTKCTAPCVAASAASVPDSSLCHVNLRCLSTNTPSAPPRPEPNPMRPEDVEIEGAAEGEELVVVLVGEVSGQEIRRCSV